MYKNLVFDLFLKIHSSARKKKCVWSLNYYKQNFRKSFSVAHQKSPLQVVICCVLFNFVIFGFIRDMKLVKKCYLKLSSFQYLPPRHHLLISLLFYWCCSFSLFYHSRTLSLRVFSYKSNPTRHLYQSSCRWAKREMYPM